MVSQIEKAINQNSNIGDSETAKALRVAQGGTLASFIGSLNSQERRFIALNISDMQKKTDKMLQRVESLLTGNNFDKLSPEKESIILKGVDDLADLIKKIRSGITSFTSSEELTMIANNLDKAQGLEKELENKIS